MQIGVAALHADANPHYGSGKRLLWNGLLELDFVESLKERTSNQAIFLLEEKSIHTYVPYVLLSYRKSIQVIEPQSLKGKLVAVATELMEYYQL